MNNNCLAQLDYSTGDFDKDPSGHDLCGDGIIDDMAGTFATLVD